MMNWNAWLEGDVSIRLKVGAVLDGIQAVRATKKYEISPLSEGCAVKFRELGSDESVDFDASSCVLVPGFVNAHTHLDLSHIGPQPYDKQSGFEGWLGMVLRERATTESAIQEATRRGLELSLHGGVVAVGDISGTWSNIPARVLARSPLGGTSFIEAFGLGDTQDDALTRLTGCVQDSKGRTRSNSDGDVGVVIGTSPHAPYTAGPALIHGARRILDESVPMMIHVAESHAEREFVAEGVGPKRALLQRIGTWTDSSLDGLAMGKTPVAHVLDALSKSASGTVFAHVNDASDDDITALRRSRVHVAYCPRASAYFGHHEDFGEHRYRDMLDADVNVALGTDSIINCPAEHADRLTTFDDVRLLSVRDGFDPVHAVACATWRGARSLCLPEDWFMFGSCASSGTHRRAGILAGVALIESPSGGDLIQSALQSNASPVLFGRDRVKRAALRT